MDNETKMKIVLLMALPIAIFIFIKFCLYGYSGKKKFILKAKKDGSYVKAYKVGSKVNTGDYSSGSAYQFDTVSAEYEYFINGKIYHKSFNFNAKSGNGATAPHSITVYYDKKKPKKQVCDVEVGSGTKPFGCFLSILIPVIFILVVYNIWINIV